MYCYTTAVHSRLQFNIFLRKKFFYLKHFYNSDSIDGNTIVSSDKHARFLIVLTHSWQKLHLLYHHLYYSIVVL